jgi:hypothetical protein
MDRRVAVSRASQVLAIVGMLSLCGVVHPVGPPAAGLQMDAPAVQRGGGLTTTGTCYFGYFGGANGPAGRGFAGGAITLRPIYMNEGVVFERTQDVGISGLTFGWSHIREYGSLQTGLSGVEQTEENGMRWKTSGIGPYVRLSGSDLELYGSVATKRVFVSSGGSTFNSPTKYDGVFLKTGSGPDSYTLTDELTGQITKFDGLDPGTTNQGRINRFRSREFETSGQAGVSFAYSTTHGNVTNVTTPQGTSVAYTYVVGGFEADRISKVEVKNGGGTVIQKSEYVYFGTATSPHANTGHSCQYGPLR